MACSEIIGINQYISESFIGSVQIVMKNIIVMGDIFMYKPSYILYSINTCNRITIRWKIYQMYRIEIMIIF